MSWWMPHNFEKKRGFLEKRMAVMKALRSFFDMQDFLEVETPALQVMPCADIHIHGFQTEYFGPDLKPVKEYYLHTSPEFEMKKLLVAGLDNIYQICKAYRNGERTKMHSPEFTMMEWYRAATDYSAMMDDCEALFRHVAKAADCDVLKNGERKCDPFLPFERLSVAEAFARYMGADLNTCLNDRDALSQLAMEQGVRVVESDTWGDIFHEIMAEKIEPFLGDERASILYGYPSSMACLSRKMVDDPRYAERFELYVCGVELANAFSELIDAAEQRKRFEEEMKAKHKHYGFSYPLDEDFLAALEYGMPEASGIALGVDRLVMLICGAEVIDDVLWTAKP